MEAEHPLSELCRAYGVSRSGYYAWRQRAPSARQQANVRLLEEIQALRQGEEVCYGSPRLAEELKERGHVCSENRVARLMRAHGLRAQVRPRWVPRTTDSDHDEPIAPNRLAQRAAPDGPNQVWLQDITYVPTGQGWLYPDLADWRVKTTIFRRRPRGNPSFSRGRFAKGLVVQTCPLHGLDFFVMISRHHVSALLKTSQGWQRTSLLECRGKPAAARSPRRPAPRPLSR